MRLSVVPVAAGLPRCVVGGLYGLQHTAGLQAEGGVVAAGPGGASPWQGGQHHTVAVCRVPTSTNSNSHILHNSFSPKKKVSVYPNKKKILVLKKIQMH